MKAKTLERMTDEQKRELFNQIYEDIRKRRDAKLPLTKRQQRFLSQIHQPLSDV